MGVSLSEGLEADSAKLADNQGLVQAQVATGTDPLAVSNRGTP